MVINLEILVDNQELCSHSVYPMVINAFIFSDTTHEDGDSPIEFIGDDLGDNFLSKHRQ